MVVLGTFGPGRAASRLRDRYEGWMLGGAEKAAEETASGQSSKIDVKILDWIIGVLRDHNSLKTFEAIPGFFNSKLVNHLKIVFPMELLEKLIGALDGIIGRAWSSDSVKRYVERGHQMTEDF